MSKSSNGALVGQIIKGVIAGAGALVVSILSAKKGKQAYTSWKNKRKKK